MKLGAQRQKRTSKIDCEYFSVKDLAAYSGISERTLWGLIRQITNPIPNFRIGRLVRVKRAEFDNWMEKTCRNDTAQKMEQIVDEITRKLQKK
jgi:excisionase family DNA binding protein